MSSKIERSEQLEVPNHFNRTVEEPAVPRLAEGTRQNIHVQSAKGLRISTRCQTVESFIETYHPICEDTAIFIPNTRRSVGAITQFAFALAGGRPVLVGIGAVMEEFTTTENRFGHVGIVISLQQLARGSTSVFDQLLAARAARKTVAVDHTPAPIFARTVTGPVTIADAVKAPRSEAANVQIPNPGDRHERTKTVLGIPAISKPPALAIKVPNVVAAQAKKPDAKRPTRAAATPAAPAAVPDESWEAIEQSLDAVPATTADASDTVRDVMPYALHHSLGNATPANATPASLDAVPVAIPDADVFETVTAVGTADEIQVLRALSVAMPAVMVAPIVPSETVAEAPAECAEPIELSEPLSTPAAILAPSPTQIVEAVVTSRQRSSHPWRWVAAFAMLVMLLAASATVTVFVEPSISTRHEGAESAPVRTDSAWKSALAASEPEAAASAPSVQPLDEQTTTPAELASVAPAQTTKAPARAKTQKVRPRPRPVRRVSPKCRSLDCL